MIIREPDVAVHRHALHRAVRLDDVGRAGGEPLWQMGKSAGHVGLHLAVNRNPFRPIRLRPCQAEDCAELLTSRGLLFAAKS